MMPDPYKALEMEIERLQFEANAWRFTTYCFCGSTLSFLACILFGGCRA
jgi:hypothetical protein